MQNVNWNKTQDRYTEIAPDIDIKRIFRVLWSCWYWIVSAMILALALWFAFLKIAKPRYVAEVSLKYNVKQTELDELSQLIQADDATNKEYATEKYVIQSEEVINGAIKKLDCPFTFYRETTFRQEDVYPFLPFRAEVISYEGQAFKAGQFEIQKEGIITYKSEDGTDVRRFDLMKDTLISVKGLSFKINSIERLSENYTFIYNDLNTIKQALDDQIGVDEEERNLPIVNVSFTYFNQQFTQDFLEKLIEAYEEYNLDQKKRSSNLTINFIREQIKIYDNSLRKASSQLEMYKQQKSVPSLQVSTNDVMGQLSNFETQKNTIEIQKSYINLLEQSLTNRFEPVNVGSIGLDNSSDGVLLKLVGDLNKLILDRKAFIIGKNLSVNNPVVKAADDEIERVREQILSNIKVQRQRNEGTLRIINQNLSLLKSRMNALPSVERELGYLQNNRDVNEKIYLLLINKEIEASIVKAGMLPSFNVLTRTDAYQIYPQTVRILLVCIMLGLVIGVGSIFLVRFLNNKFTEIAKIGQSNRVHLLGMIQKYPEKLQNNEKDLAQFLDGRSLFSEFVNGIRTNLSFLADASVGKGKILSITSSVAGEGKSFITINLATSLTKTGKKVLIIVSDLRRSKLHYFFNNNNKIGLSSYLSGKIDNYQKAIQYSVIEGLDFIPAGPVPFNPSELIQHARLEEMLKSCQQVYDFILIDTAPVGLVSDSVPLLRRSDLTLFIIRWMYSNKEAYLLADQVAEEFGLTSVGVIVNDYYHDDLYASLVAAAHYPSKGYNYSYKYAYNYNGNANGYYTNESSDKGSFWRKLKRWGKKSKS